MEAGRDVNLDQARAAYRHACHALDTARQRAQDARRAHWNGTGTHHAMTTANQAAIDARAAWETARDELVAAALAATSHHAQGEGQLDTFGNEAV